MRKKCWAVALALLFVLPLVACGGASNTSQVTTVKSDVVKETEQEVSVPLADEPVETTSDDTAPASASFDEILNAVKEGLSKGLTRENSKSDCTATRNGNLVTITLLDENATKVSAKAISGDEESLTHWNQFASKIATTEKTCEDTFETYGHGEAIIHLYVVDYENPERRLLSISHGQILYDSVNTALSDEAEEAVPQQESESTPKVSTVSPTLDMEWAIRSRINEYSGTDIDSITLNEDLGTETEDDYIALVYLTWNVQNSGKLSKKVLKMYSDDLAATVAKDVPDIQEIAIFWTVPYLNASAKCAYQRRGEGMYEMDMMWDSAFN